MKELYKKNMDALSDYTPAYQLFEKKCESIQYTEEHVFLKGDRLFFKENDRDYALIGQNKDWEAEKYLKNIDFKKDSLVFVIGMAHVAMLEKLIHSCSKESRIIVVEPNEKVMKYCLEHRDYTNIFSSKKVIIFQSNEVENLTKAVILMLNELHWNNLIYNMHMIMLANYEVYKPFVKELAKKLMESTRSSFLRMGNSVEDMFVGFEHTVKNVKHLMTANSVDDLKGIYEGIPAIIVAAGPSLEKNIHLLKRAESKAVILTCDASMNACKLHDVKPDAIVTIERVEETYQYFYEGKTFDKELTLIAPTNVWPKLLDEFQGKRVLIQKTENGSEALVLNNLENIQNTDIGVSCANTAYTAACVMGCNPIILIGQDFAYTDNKKHSDIAHTEFEGENEIGEEDYTDKYVEDVYGNLVKTDWRFDWFRDWLETAILAHDKYKVIDATEGGAKIRGTEIMTFEEAINQYCTKDKDKMLCDKLKDKVLSKDEKIARYNAIVDSLEQEVENLMMIQSKAQAHYKVLEEIYTDDFEKSDDNTLIKAVKKMSAGNDIISYIGGHKDIFFYFEQIIRQTVTHVKQIPNELNADNVIANIKLQGNLMGMIMRSSEVIIAKYKEMIEEVKSEKVEEYECNE